MTDPKKLAEAYAEYCECTCDDVHASQCWYHLTLQDQIKGSFLAGFAAALESAEVEGLEYVAHVMIATSIAYEGAEIEFSFAKALAKVTADCRDARRAYHKLKESV